MTAFSLKRVLVPAVALALMSVPARAQSVDVDYDKAVNFKAFKTYALGTVKMSDDASPLMVQRTVSALEGQMSAIGFRKVEANPDLIVEIQSSTREELSYTTWGDFGPYWGGPYPYWGGVAYPFWWSSGFSGVDVQTILLRTLIVDMIDARTEKVVFRGTAEDRVSHKAKKNERKAYEAVAEIFEESPWGEDFDRD
jgi:Domain of unknown function (DUF4136)